MPTIGVSPGVYGVERDLSLYVPSQSTTIFAVVGSASWGPTETSTLITDEGSLVAMFGPPSTTHLGLLAAIQYLRVGRQLKFVRVADYDVAASVNIRDAANVGNALAVSAVYTGTFGNTLSLIVAAGTEANTYRISVRVSGVIVENFDNLRVGAAATSHRNYVETRINGISTYIAVTADDTFATLLAGTSTLTSGADGTPTSNADYVGLAGTPPTIPATGLQIFADPDDEEVDMIAVPGIINATVVNALITIAEGRQDCLALLEVPQSTTVSDAIDWHNGTGGGVGDPTSALNSSYAALYYPWVQIYDGYSNSNVWCPPSGHAAAAIANTDYLADPWFAPAGMVRARFTDILSVEHSATLGERDYMYGYGNAINPFVAFTGVNGGTVIWGQRTLQRTPTALDRINVRRMMNYIKKNISAAARGILFEPNDQETWSQFTSLASTYLDEVRARRGLTDFRVICDSTTNTEAVVNNNEMRAKILLQPTRTAEIITLEFVLLATGAQFEEV